MDRDDDTNSEPATPPATRGKLRTSFMPTPEPLSDADNGEDEEEEVEDFNEDGEDEHYEEGEDDDKDYADWDMEDEEETQVKPKSLSASGIFQARETKINKVRDILGVPAHIAQALLQHYQWDEEKFLMRFLENPVAIYKEAKVEAPKEQKDGASKMENIACSVCFEDDQDEITALACNHYFCNDCWRTHIEVALREGRSLDISCMQHKCKVLMPDYIVRKIVSPETYQKYAIFLSKGFVESNANMKWCPKPGCTNAVDASQAVREGKCLVAKCECSYKFCFLCSEESHTPATCAMMKEWAKKCADDSETYNWIAANTKDCPQKNCGVPIEKNDGCFMMTCQKCRFQFCWLCCEPWSSHNDHFRCNKYNEAKLDNKPAWLDGKSNTDARQALDRYLFYYNRFINHQNSLKFESKTREKARATMDALQKNGSYSYIDVQFIEAALNQLLENRRTLKNTYVYAFYQQDPLKKDLFEFSQADLEKITEDIAQLLLASPEKLIEAATIVKSKTQVASRSLINLLYDENL
jgi:ariadne-1